MKKQPDLSPSVDQVFKTDRWGRYQWSRHLEDGESSRTTLDEGKRKIHSFDKFFHEVFQRLYAEPPKLEKTRPEDAWAVRAHEEMSNLPDFDRLRNRCFGDRTLAGDAAKTFAASVAASLPASDLKDPEPLRNQIKGLKTFMEQTEDQEVKKKIGSQLNSLTKEGVELVNEHLKYNASLDETQLRKIVKEALVSATEEVNETVEMIDAFAGWGDTSSVPTGVTPGDKMALAERIRKSPKLQRLAREAGRMRRIAASKQRSKTSQSRNEVSDIERGNDLGQVLPSELVKLADPVMRLDFYRSFIERTLLQYKIRGVEPQGKGPIVVCIDNSGSMAGDPEMWAKSVALALIQVASMQKRQVGLIQFNTAVKESKVLDPKNLDMESLLRSMEVFYSGRTSFEAPLNEALSLIEGSKFAKADVVFITDGCCSIGADFLNKWNVAKGAKKFTCYGVFIGYGSHAAMSTFCDVVTSVSDFANDGSATDTIFEV